MKGWSTFVSGTACSTVFDALEDSKWRLQIWRLRHWCRPKARQIDFSLIQISFSYCVNPIPDLFDFDKNLFEQDRLTVYRIAEAAQLVVNISHDAKLHPCCGKFLYEPPSFNLTTTCKSSNEENHENSSWRVALRRSKIDLRRYCLISSRWYLILRSDVSRAIPTR